MGQWNAEAIDTWRQLDDKLLQLESLLTLARNDSLKSAETGHSSDLSACYGTAREARLLAEELFRHTRRPSALLAGAADHNLQLMH
ncbi:MAG: hypothetical protein RJA36_3847 [Pseudomonadota bacterium]|jgi:hypothetical protein